LKNKKNPNLQYSEKWAQGTVTDIVFNIFGFLTGMLINRKLHKKKIQIDTKVYKELSKTFY
jgi:glycopeptide antibiotics resistance protein